MFLLLLIPILLFDSSFLYFWVRRKSFNKLSLYFCLTRLIIIIALVVGYIDFVNYGSTFGSSSFVHIIAPTAYSFMIAATSFLMYRTGLHKRLTLFTTLISILGILCLVVLQLSLQFSSLRIAPISNSHDDNQISRDFQLLSQDIQGYALDRNQLPPTMLDAVNISNSYSSTENVKSRISKYTYKKVGTNNFQLCATFVTDTSSDNPQPGAKGVTQAYYHHIGYQCFNFNEF